MFRWHRVTTVALVGALIVVGGWLAEPAQAQDDPVLPGDAGWAEKITQEALALADADDPAARAQTLVDIARERIREMDAAGAADRPEAVEAAAGAYEEIVRDGVEAIVDAAQSQDVLTVVEEATGIHLDVLSEVMERVPAEARPAIERALAASRTGHETAVGALSRTPAPGATGGQPPAPDGPPGTAPAPPAPSPGPGTSGPPVQPPTRPGR